ncbi:MAG: hypothetical protein WCF84_02010 [Anaerolineae bacterium]
MPVWSVPVSLQRVWWEQVSLASVWLQRVWWEWVSLAPVWSVPVWSVPVWSVQRVWWEWVWSPQQSLQMDRVSAQ